MAIGAPFFAQVVAHSLCASPLSGEAHKECATTCAKKGAPMAILTEDGKLYQITGGLAADNNAKLVAHVSHQVEVTGDVTEKDGKMTIAADSLKMISK